MANVVVGSTKSSPLRLGYQCSNHGIYHLEPGVLNPCGILPARGSRPPPEPNSLSLVFKLCRALCSFPDAGITIGSFWSRANMCTAVNRGPAFLFPLGEALQPDYNPVAKCRQRGRVPPTVSNLRQSANCQSRTAARFGL